MEHRDPEITSLSFAQLRQDALWRALVLGSPLPEDTAVPQCSVLPVLTVVRQWNSTLSWREQLLRGQAVESFVRSHLAGLSAGSGVIHLGDHRYLTVLCLDQRSGMLDETVSACDGLIRLCQRELLCDVSCYIGTVTEPQALGAMTDQLVALDSQNVAELSLRFLGGSSGSPGALKLYLEQGRTLLRSERFDEFLEQIYSCLMAEGAKLTAEALNDFNQDVLQLLYTIMNEKSVAAHMLFRRPESTRQFRDAPLSISNTLTWIFSAVTSLSETLRERYAAQDYTEQVMTYIRSHLRESFTRQDIADHVHLSQNHLARLFRKETGMSIAEFTLQERMNQATELLVRTDRSVAEVAQQVGYENYSYFLTSFRRFTGQTPSEYRVKHTSEQGERGEEP